MANSRIRALTQRGGARMVGQTGRTRVMGGTCCSSKQQCSQKPPSLMAVKRIGPLSAEIGKNMWKWLILEEIRLNNKEL